MARLLLAAGLIYQIMAGMAATKGKPHCYNAHCNIDVRYRYCRLYHACAMRPVALLLCFRRGAAQAGRPVNVIAKGGMVAKFDWS
jgi:hypothetical protein